MKSLCEITYDDVKGLRAMILDVDGVLTDGKITYTSAGEEVKSFHVRDGSGIKYWHRSGKMSAILSGRPNGGVCKIVERRAEELSISKVIMGAKDKLPCFYDIIKELGVEPNECVYIGDDLPDVPPMREAGLGIAVADAVEEVKETADFVTELSGGSGAVREAVVAMLKAGGLWSAILERYFPGMIKES